MEYTSGSARGMRAIEVKNGSGLSFTVLPDRNMDISYASYKGIPLSFVSKVGEKSPVFYEESDFLRNFTAGLITTCGITYCGAENKSSLCNVAMSIKKLRWHSHRAEKFKIL